MAKPGMRWLQQQQNQKTTELAIPRNLSYISGKYNNVQLAEGFGGSSGGHQPTAIQVRPPSRQEHSSVKPPQQGPQCETQPRTIMRRRAKSLPTSPERGRSLSKAGRRQKVRFADCLGLELEEVKIFKTGEDPSVPFHVLSRLMLSSELASGRYLEIPLPYLQTDFSQQPGDQSDFRERLMRQRVCLERVLCSELGISGSVRVINLSFEKEVIVRYSFTSWTSNSDVKAWWDSSGPVDGDPVGVEIDQFCFWIPVPSFVLQPGMSLEFAICYRVMGCEFWDNNDGKNYSLTCHSYKITVPKDCEGSLVHFM
ncbi:protein phosphatase 1 regulatory subunit 3D-like [Polypterus senegalus]